MQPGGVRVFGGVFLCTIKCPDRSNSSDDESFTREHAHSFLGSATAKGVCKASGHGHII